MQKFPPIRGPLALLLGVLLGLTACDAPEQGEVPSEPQLASLLAPSLLECPSTVSYSSEGLLSPVGGLLTFAGNLVLVPPTAVEAPVEIGIEVPASRYMLVELTANGYDHWQFLSPITVSLDYSRCDIGLLDPPVTVWHVDPASGELLGHMGGFDNRLARRVTFTTDHFSGYAIAN